jgi:SAM-dependent methyltransferase
MSVQNEDDVRSVVRDHYAKVAETNGVVGCCGGGAAASLDLGYAPEDLENLPEGANMGLGCGNPQAIAALSPGETVLDLGSGGGFDCFLAARQVGPSGRVIGVDMTPAMVSKARANAQKLGATNVEFRLGEIEHLPVADGTVDAVLSNCVINLSPDKAQVFRDAFRALAPGGRLAISDVVAIDTIPDALRARLDALTGCVAGAADVREVEAMLAAAGFEDIAVSVKPESRAIISGWFPGSGAERYVASATIEARKPGGAARKPGAGAGEATERATARGETRAASGACCAPGCCAPARGQKE